MAFFTELFPTAADLLNREPEDVAGFIFEHLQSVRDADRGHILNANNFSNFVRTFYRNNGALNGRLEDEIVKSILEAWSVLHREGLLISSLDGGWSFIARRAANLKTSTDIVEFRRRTAVRFDSFHPRISAVAFPSFIRGDYETAVLNAYKELEIAIRDACALDNSHFGESLMREAFRDNGTLTDQAELPAERLALSHLFAGAYGRYRNPSAHRKVAHDPHEAGEIIGFASHLMKIVDQRTPP